MLDYRRFISYLYSYVEGEKGVNVGYIRCEQRQGNCRFTLNLLDRQGIEGGRYKVYLYKINEEERPIGYYLDEILIRRCNAELRKQTSSENVWNTNHRLEDFDGVIAIYDKDHMYVSQWSDEPMQLSQFQTYREWQQQRVPEQPVYQKESEGLALHAVELKTVELATELMRELSEECKEEREGNYKPASEVTDIAAMNSEAMNSEAMESKVMEPMRKPISDATLRLMESRTKLPDFENHEIYDCVRIVPNDIGLLEMENWRLGVNSFLTHGYYNYKYLMLGKLRFQDGVVKAVLGVPGVYDNKEQYIAKIFGFEVFVPVKHTNIKTGNFGYWIVELV
ncbi:MAG: hypothetical protein IJ040_07840 [Lachnospiraceae bacterium]|nr:hypothetical protein [Lachnospiraceae bacterium]